MKAKAIWVAAAILLLVVAGAGTAIYLRHLQRARFEAQIDIVATDISEVIEKLDSDQAVYDMADDRAVASIQKLKTDAWTEKQRLGATDLAIEVAMLRACRASRKLPGKEFENCLDATKPYNDSAFERLNAR